MKIIQMSTYDETNHQWRTPTDLGAKAENVDVNTITPTGTDTSEVITGSTDVDVAAGDTVKDFAEKYNRRGVRINNKLSNIQLNIPSYTQEQFDALTPEQRPQNGSYFTITDDSEANRPLYQTTGQNVDGAMSQKAITDAIAAGGGGNVGTFIYNQANRQLIIIGGNLTYTYDSTNRQLVIA